MSERKKVLVKEKLAAEGVDLLRQDFDVDLGVDWTDDELMARIKDYDALIVRSATKVTAAVIEAVRGSASWAAPAWAWTTST